MKIPNGKDAASVIHTKFAKSQPQLIHRLPIWHELYLPKSKLPQVSIKTSNSSSIFESILLLLYFYFGVFIRLFLQGDGNPAIDLCVWRTARVQNKSWKGQRTSTVKGFPSNLNLYKKNKTKQHFHAFSVNGLK